MGADGVAPVAFGGRDRQIQELNQWLADPNAPPNLLIAAPAGRGKTALLVRWLAQVADGWKIALVPISITFATNNPLTFYQALAVRLGEILGDPLKEASSDPAIYRDTIIRYLDLLRTSQLRCLLVIDGLDEALGWEVNTSVLPLNPGQNVRIVTSARLLAGDRGPNDWLRRLGWNGSRAPARTLDLALLDRNGISDVLQHMGYPTATIENEIDVLSELLRLTEGAPLLLELYIKALLDHTNHTATLRLKDLRNVDPGLTGFFKTWWEQQRQAWRHATPQVDERTVEASLAVLSCALGPIKLAELTFLIRQVHKIDRALSADVLRPIERFVIGDGIKIGYSFTHPKLADYFRDDHFGGGEAVIQTRNGIIQWGADIVRDLNLDSATFSAKPNYEYLLKYYAQHLLQAGSAPESFVPLVTNGWRKAWESFEGGPRGFANDVEIAWAAIRRLGELSKVDFQCHCALVLSSLKSFGENIPGSILLAAVRQRVLSNEQAVYYARIARQVYDGVDTLIKIAIGTPYKSLQYTEIISVAFTRAISTRDRNSRDRALSLLVPHLSADQFDEAFALSKALGLSREDRYMTALAPRLTAEQVQEALADILASDTMSGLFGLAPRLTPQQLSETLSRVVEMERGELRRSALTWLAPHLSVEQLDAAISMTVDIPGSREDLLWSLQPYLPPGKRTPVRPAKEVVLLSKEQVKEAFAQGADSDYESVQADTIKRLAPYLALRELNDALAVARAVRNNRLRAEALISIVPHLPVKKRPVIINEALAAAKAIGMERPRLQTLVLLAPHLSKDLLNQLYATLREATDPRLRAQALVSISQYSPPAGRREILCKAIDAIQAIEQFRRVDTFLQMAKMLYLECPKEAFNVVIQFRSESDQRQAIDSLAAELSQDHLEQVLTLAKSFSWDQPRGEVLESIVPYLDPARLSEALVIATTIKNDSIRSRTVAAISFHLEPQHNAAILEAAQTISDEKFRAQTFAAVAPRLSSDEIEMALAATQTISDQQARTSALAAFVPYLPAEKRVDALRSAIEMADRSGDALSGSVPKAYLLPLLSAEQRVAILTEGLAEANATWSGDSSVRRSMFENLSVLSSLFSFVSQISTDEFRRIIEEDKVRDDLRKMAIGYLAPHQLAKLGGDYLATYVSCVKNSSIRSRLVRTLSPHLSSKQLEEVMSLSASLRHSDEEPDDYEFEEPTIELFVEKVMGDEFGKDIDVSIALFRVFRSSLERGADFIPHISVTKAKFRDAIAKVVGIADEQTRAVGLLYLTLLAPDDDKGHLLDAIVRAVAHCSRPTAFTILAECAPLFGALGGRTACKAIHSTINEVAIWYP